MPTFESERNNVGPGWQPLIEELHAELLKVVPNYGVVQIKEKFGGLRYYTSSGDGNWPAAISQMYELIAAAEEASYSICEDCGATDTTKTGGIDPNARHSWIRTLCDSCRVTALENRNKIVAEMREARS